MFRYETRVAIYYIPVELDQSEIDTAQQYDVGNRMFRYHSFASYLKGDRITDIDVDDFLYLITREVI